MALMSSVMALMALAALPLLALVVLVAFNFCQLLPLLSLLHLTTENHVLTSDSYGQPDICFLCRPYDYLFICHVCEEVLLLLAFIARQLDVKLCSNIANTGSPPALDQGMFGHRLWRHCQPFLLRRQLCVNSPMLPSFLPFGKTSNLLDMWQHWQCFSLPPK